MKQYLNVINEKFKNKSYFINFINRYSFYKEKRQHNEHIYGIVVMILSVFYFAGVLGFLLSEHSFVISVIKLIGSLVPYCFTLFLVGHKMISSDLNNKRNFEKKLYMDLSENHELIKDLSELVVNDNTEKSFNEIVNNIVKNQDGNTFSEFENLLKECAIFHNQVALSNKRDALLSKLKIDMSKKDSNEESFQFKAREKVLEML